MAINTVNTFNSIFCIFGHTYPGVFFETVTITIAYKVYILVLAMLIMGLVNIFRNVCAHVVTTDHDNINLSI